MTSAQSPTTPNSNFSYSRPRTDILATVVPYVGVENFDEASNIDDPGPKVLSSKLSAALLSIKFSVAPESTNALQGQTLFWPQPEPDRDRKGTRWSHIIWNNRRKNSSWARFARRTAGGSASVNTKKWPFFPHLWQTAFRAGKDERFAFWLRLLP